MKIEELFGQDELIELLRKKYTAETGEEPINDTNPSSAFGYAKWLEKIVYSFFKEDYLLR